MGMSVKSLAKFGYMNITILIGLILVIFSMTSFYISTQPEEVLASPGCEGTIPSEECSGRPTGDECEADSCCTWLAFPQVCAARSCTSMTEAECNNCAYCSWVTTTTTATTTTESTTTTTTPDAFPKWVEDSNSTNTTVAGEITEFRHQWTDDNALSGYIFFLFNGSNSSTPFCEGTLACSGLSETDCDNCSQCSWSGAGSGAINNTPTSFTDTAGDTTNEANAYDNDTATSSSTVLANGDDDPSVTFHDWGANTTEYTAITLNMEYSDDSTAASDQYQISYSIDGGTGWTIWVAWTTGGQSKTLIRKDVTPSNTDQIQIKIATDRVGGGDGDTLSVYRLWTNSTYTSAGSCSDSGACGSCSGQSACQNCTAASCSWNLNETEFVNYTWVSMTGTGNWSNVTKTVNSTENALIKWYVKANDSSDQWNTTPKYSYYTTSAVVGDTCDCSSIQAGTSIDCSENCIIDETCDVGGIDVIFTNSGIITITADVSNIKNYYLPVGCTRILKGGKRWG